MDKPTRTMIENLRITPENHWTNRLPLLTGKVWENLVKSLDGM